MTHTSLNRVIWQVMSYLSREDGQDLVEYGLVIALIAFGTITALKSVGSDISLIYSAINSTVTSSVS
jgi:Flp pilus assembly pilin Flp